MHHQWGIELPGFSIFAVWQPADYDSGMAFHPRVGSAAHGT